jgi:adenosylmethionine---8-amino-7-oxononanoate aminotransferase
VSWVERDAAVVWHGFTQMACYGDNEPVIVERAEGHELIDVDGKRYLDAVSSLWVNTLGHRVPELDQAIRDQLDRVAQTTMLGNGNRVVIELAEALAAVVPVDEPHFLFASDGSAVEQALRIAFQYWTNEGHPARTAYLAFGDAYHGDTLGSVSVGDGGFGTDLLGALRFPVLRAPSYHNPDALEIAADMVRKHAGQLAAVVVEPLVQTFGAGVRIAEREAFAPLQRACNETGVLLICDEVATGFGRTGTLFACEQVRLRPDLLCLGKGLTGGYLPMSATVANSRVFDAFSGTDLSERTLYYGHSFSGNALAAAVALRHLLLLQEWNVLDNVAQRSTQLGTLLRDRLLPLAAVIDVRLVGLIGAVELRVPDGDVLFARRVASAVTRRGVLIRSLGSLLTVVPPLTVTAAEIDQIVDAIAAGIVEVAGT